MATPQTNTSIDQKALTKAIKSQIPKPKRHKWTQIGAKAIAGNQGALARLTKRGLLPKQPKPSGGSGSGSSGGGAPKYTPYSPPAITDAMLAKTPSPGATPGTYHDAITGLDVTANFGPNPYNPGGGGGGATAAGTAPKVPKSSSRAPGGAKLPGSAKPKKGTVPLMYRTPNGFTIRHVGQDRARKILQKREMEGGVSARLKRARRG